MSGNDVVIQMSAQDAELVSAWQRARKGPEGVEDALKKLGKQAKQTGKETQDSFGSAALSIVGVTSAVGIATAAVRMFDAELKAARQRAAEIANVNIGLAGSQRAALESLPPNADLTTGQLNELVSRQQNVALTTQYAAVEKALKAGGADFSAKRAAETAIAAGELAPHLAAGDLSEIAAAAVDLQKQFPTEVNPQQAVAQMLSAGRRSESSRGEVAKTLGPLLGRIRAIKPDASFDDIASLVTSLESTQGEGIGAAADLAEKFVVTATKKRFTGSLDEMIARARTDRNFAKLGFKAVCDELTAECAELLAAAEADYLTPGERADVRLMFAIVRGAVRFMGLVFACDEIERDNAGETCLVLAL